MLCLKWKEHYYSPFIPEVFDFRHEILVKMELVVVGIVTIYLRHENEAKVENVPKIKSSYFSVSLFSPIRQTVKSKC